MTSATRSPRTSLVLATALILAGCGKHGAGPDPNPPAPDAAPTRAVGPAGSAPAVPAAESAPEAAFDPATLPTTTATLGAFPYIAPPEGYSFNGTHDFPLERFTFAIGGHPVTLEGRVFRAPLTTNNGPVSSVFLERSFKTTMEALGARQLNDSVMDLKVYEAAHYDPERTDLNIGQPTHTWGVKTVDGKPVIFQLGLNGASYQVLQLEQTPVKASLLPPEAQPANVSKAIGETGKAVLHIQFETDQARLLPEGRLVVEQIATVLNSEPGLKLSIEGHTDDSGDAARNQALSLARATAVRDALVALGIDAARLRTAGHGSSQPVAANSDADGKAKNRRVELVRLG